MSVSSIGFVYAGPKHPQDPLGEAIVLHEGMSVQEYEDGTLVEISAPVGSPVMVYPLPEGGVWSQAFEHENVLYVSFWYPTGSWRPADLN